MDAGYGADTKLRTAITEFGLAYAAGIQPHTSVWRPGEGPLPHKPWSGRGRPTSQRRHDAEHHPPLATPLGFAEGASGSPENEEQPTKYFLSTLPENIRVADLVDATKLRWRIERDYQDLKQEVGLGHYEGRGWRGFHHHATLCIAAYGFSISERGALPPLPKPDPCFPSALCTIAMD